MLSRVGIKVKVCIAELNAEWDETLVLKHESASRKWLWLGQMLQRAQQRLNSIHERGCDKASKLRDADVDDRRGDDAIDRRALQYRDRELRWRERREP